MGSKEAKLPTQILIIESNEGLAKSLQNWIHEKREYRPFPIFNGEEALKELEERTFGLIVLSWQQQDPTGVALFTRLKQHLVYKNIPVLITTDSLDYPELMLLEEYQYVQVLKKPLAKDTVYKAVTQLYSQWEWFASNEGKISTMFETLKEKPVKDVVASIKKLAKSSPAPFPLLFATAKVLRGRHMIAECEELLNELKQQDPSKSLLIINELSKLYMENNLPEKAKEVLETLLKSCPDNIDHLCDLGNLHLIDRQYEQANKFFSAAEGKDPKSEKVAAGRTIAQNLAKWNTSNIGETFASTLNSIGISLTRSEKYAEGIKHYLAASRVVYNTKDQSKLFFNIGLAHLREKDKDMALEWFERAYRLDITSLKAKKYIDQLSGSIQEVNFKDLESELEELIDPP